MHPSTGFPSKPALQTQAAFRSELPVVVPAEVVELVAHAAASVRMMGRDDGGRGVHVHPPEGSGVPQKPAEHTHETAGLLLATPVPSASGMLSQAAQRARVRQLDWGERTEPHQRSWGTIQKSWQRTRSGSRRRLGLSRHFHPIQYFARFLGLCTLHTRVREGPTRD